MLIELLNDKNFDEVYALMKTSFPADERRTYSEQKELLSNPIYKIYISKNFRTGQIEAFAALWLFDDFTFIEHLAVNPNHRNAGIGTRFLNGILKIQEKTVCLEVELPDTEIAVRRIGFYERNGFFLNEYHYEQPPISKGRKPIRLYIMTSTTSWC